MVELAEGLHIVDGLGEQGFLMNVVALIGDGGGEAVRRYLSTPRRDRESGPGIER